MRLLVAVRPLLTLAAALVPLHAGAQRVNDTGQTACYNTSASIGTVALSTPDPEPAGFNEQDCTRGAAAAEAVGVLYKVGGSTRSGADYTRIANNGSPLPATAALGSNPGDWACTRDNVTGLIWEVKLNNSANLRHVGHRYTWYDTNGALNGGLAGVITLGTNTDCQATLINCNTTAYRDAVNAAGLCAANDWRLPSADELNSLVQFADIPPIDAVWFPNSPDARYWSGQSFAANPDRAWFLEPNGFVTFITKATAYQVRLVRGAP